MKGHEKSSDKLSPKVNALLIIDVQEKIIRAIYKKDSITKNIKKLIDAYQILEENIFLSAVLHNSKIIDSVVVKVAPF